MTMKQIRKISGLTQNEFANKYGFPLQTLKQWEASEGSSSHRECPRYVLDLTMRAVTADANDEFVANFKSYFSVHSNISLVNLKEKAW